MSRPKTQGPTAVQINLGKRIRHLRRIKHFSIEKLAEKADLHPTYLGDIERAKGNATVNSIAKIAEALDMNVSDLFRDPTSATPSAGTDKEYQHLAVRLQNILKDKSKISTIEEFGRILKQIFFTTDK